MTRTCFISPSSENRAPADVEQRRGPDAGLLRVPALLPARRRLPALRRAARQLDADAGALALLARQLELAAERLDQHPGERQPQTGALDRCRLVVHATERS